MAGVLQHTKSDDYSVIQGKKICYSVQIFFQNCLEVDISFWIRVWLWINEFLVFVAGVDSWNHSQKRTSCTAYCQKNKLNGTK